MAVILLEEEPALPLGAGRDVLSLWHQDLVGQAVSVGSGEVLGGGSGMCPIHSVFAERPLTTLEAPSEG